MRCWLSARAAPLGGVARSLCVVDVPSGRDRYERMGRPDVSYAARVVETFLAVLGEGEGAWGVAAKLHRVGTGVDHLRHSGRAERKHTRTNGREENINVCNFSLLQRCVGRDALPFSSALRALQNERPKSLQRRAESSTRYSHVHLLTSISHADDSYLPPFL